MPALSREGGGSCVRSRCLRGLPLPASFQRGKPRVAISMTHFSSPTRACQGGLRRVHGRDTSSSIRRIVNGSPPRDRHLLKGPRHSLPGRIAGLAHSPGPIQGGNGAPGELPLWGRARFTGPLLYGAATQPGAWIRPLTGRQRPSTGQEWSYGQPPPSLLPLPRFKRLLKRRLFSKQSLSWTFSPPGSFRSNVLRHLGSAGYLGR